MARGLGVDFGPGGRFWGSRGGSPGGPVLGVPGGPRGAPGGPGPGGVRISGDPPYVLIAGGGQNYTEKYIS